jgi:hypothetical protein
VPGGSGVGVDGIGCRFRGFSIKGSSSNFRLLLRPLDVLGGAWCGESMGVFEFWGRGLPTEIFQKVVFCTFQGMQQFS